MIVENGSIRRMLLRDTDRSHDPTGNHCLHQDTGLSSCEECPIGKLSSADRTSCGDCDAGDEEADQAGVTYSLSSDILLPPPLYHAAQAPTC